LSDALIQKIRNYPTGLWLLIIFIICMRLDTLSLPIFWDEAIYFTPPVFEHGWFSFGLEHYNPKDYHGHPVLFQILLYIFSIFFGASPLSAHLLSLCALVYFIFTTFEFLKMTYNSDVALYTLLLFISIPFVFIQSAMFVPNYLMIAFAIKALHHFTNKNYKRYALFAFLSVMTRESALAFFFIPGLYILIDIIKRKEPIKIIIYAITPLVSLIAFFSYNKYITGNLVNHPYVRSRMERNQILLDKLLNSFSSSLRVLEDSTAKNFPNIIGIILMLILIGAIFKYRNEFFKRTSIILAGAGFFFCIFFLFYGDSIVRDFTFVTLIYCLSIILSLHVFFKRNSIKFIFLSLFVVYQIPTHFNKYTIDQTWNSFIYRVRTYKEIADKINTHYPNVQSIKCSWPCLDLYKKKVFGYLNKDTFTTIYDWEGEILVISKLNNQLNYVKTDYTIWQKEHSFGKDDKIIKTEIYKKIKEVKEEDYE